jgi:hypothetical protein
MPANVKRVDGRRRQSKHRGSHRRVKNRISIDLNLVDSVVEPRHARFNFILEGCVDYEGLNSLCDLPHCTPYGIPFRELPTYNSNIYICHVCPT